jgi:hypothetical protein
MLQKSISEITEEDLHSLVTEGRREDTQLEFKLSLPGRSDEEKKEFLKDVSAMANSQGGDIIYGIREDRSNPEDAGKATELVGITDAGEDATKLWMSELLNSSIEERLIGVAIRAIQLNAGGFALIVRVPRSWNSPHVVRHRNHWRFYARNSAGVYAMNVTDVRTAFLLSVSLGQQLKNFREERLIDIINDRSDVVINQDWSQAKKDEGDTERKSLLVIHIQPFDSVKPGYAVDVTQALNGEADNLRLIGGYQEYPSRRLNFDGLLVSDDNDFLQIYRNGTTEEVDSRELSPIVDGNRSGPEIIGASDLDIAIFKGVGRRLAILKSLGVTSPVLVSLALLGVRGCRLLVRRLVYVGDNPGFYDHKLSPHPIDRDSLFLNGLVVENLQALPLEGYREANTGREYESWHAVESLLRPYCDSLWNAVGYSRSEYFDPNGKWLGQVYRPDRP